MAAKKKAIGYVRVSRTGGRSGPEYQTIDIQKESIRKCCAGHDWELTDILVEEDRSGGDADRPLLLEALARIQSGEVQAIAVWKISRFSRSLSQGAADIELIKKAGGHIAAGDEPFDTSDDAGQLMVSLLMVFAQYELAVLTEQWKVIRSNAIERGVFPAQAPLGYLKVKSTPTRHDHVSAERAREILDGLGLQDRPVIVGGLVPCPKAAPVVRELFEARAHDTQTLAALTRVLNERLPRPDGEVWVYQQLRNMFRSRAYLGEIPKGTETHAPIIKKSLFQAVQRVGPTRVRRSDVNDFLLSGKVYCAGCSYPMSGGTNRFAGGVVDRVYRCPGTRGTGRCPESAHTSAIELEEAVWEKAAQLRSLTASVSQEKAPDLDALDEAVEEAGAALMDLASVEMRKSLGKNWGLVMAQLSAEKDDAESKRDTAYAKADRQAAQEYDWDSLGREIQEELLLASIDLIMVRRKPRRTKMADPYFKVFWAGEPLPPVGGRANRIAPTRYAFAP